MKTQSVNRWLLAWSWLIELLLILILIPSSHIQNVMNREAAMIETYYGPGTMDWIDSRVGEWYGQLFIDTGVKQAMYSYFDFTGADQQNPEMAGFGDLIFRFFITVLDRWFITVELFMQRRGQLWLWLLPLLFILAAICADGAARWKIRRSNFSYPSPFQ